MISKETLTELGMLKIEPMAVSQNPMAWQFLRRDTAQTLSNKRKVIKT